VTFTDSSLDRLETDATFSGGFSGGIVKAYRKAVQHIRAATDERTLYARRSFRFEKLKGNREGQHSLRLNDQWRLIVEFREGTPSKTVCIVEIVDYH
jgi:proteic killer suppression protein